MFYTTREEMIELFRTAVKRIFLNKYIKQERRAGNADA